MHDEHDLKYNIQLNGGATPHTFTTTHTWRRTLARETLMGATSWLKGCSWQQPRSRDDDGRHHGSKAFMVVRPHAPRHDDAACDELLTAHTTRMATPHITQDTYDIHGGTTWLEGSTFGDADAVL